MPAPGGRRELDQVIGEIASTPLDRSRPLWEFHFAEGMADDRFALIGKVHHTLADGVASANLLARLMDLAGSAQDERDDYTTCDPPSRTGSCCGRRGVDHVQHIAALPRLMRGRRPGIRPGAQAHQGARRPSRHGQDVQGAADLPQPCGLAGPDVRDGARCRWPKSRKPAKHLGVTFNDIVLAMAAGGLRDCCCATTDGPIDRSSRRCRSAPTGHRTGSPATRSAA